MWIRRLMVLAQPPADCRLASIRRLHEKPARCCGKAKCSPVTGILATGMAAATIRGRGDCDRAVDSPGAGPSDAPAWNRFPPAARFLAAASVRPGAWGALKIAAARNFPPITCRGARLPAMDCRSIRTMAERPFPHHRPRDYISRTRSRPGAIYKRRTRHACATRDRQSWVAA